MDNSVHSFPIHYSSYDSIFGSGHTQVVGFCEHGDKTSGCIKCREFLNYLRNCLTYQEELCFIELVITENYVVSK
jgi:hypothetical protein